MSIKVDSSGRRWVRGEVEVPGSVEEVWRAISTEGGLSAWFTRSEFPEGADGKPTHLICYFGPGISSAAKITKWDAPRGFSVISDEFIPGGPEVSTDWKISEGADGTCLLSVEHSLFVDTDEYDNYVEGTEAGWPAFFRILQIYMSHHRGQPCALIEVMGAAADGAQAWSELATALGFAGVEKGERFAAPPGKLRISGVVDTVPDETEVILHVEEPTGGVAHLFVWPLNDQILLSIRFYLYGEDAAEVVSLEEPAWRSWMEERFPSSQG